MPVFTETLHHQGITDLVFGSIYRFPDQGSNLGPAD
jgi:hypothetical protein